MVRRYENGNWIDASFVRRFSDGNWIDANEVKRYENGNWTRAFPYQRFVVYNTGSGTTVTQVGEADLVHVEGTERTIIGSLIFLEPRDDLQAPFTIEIDWEYNNPNSTYSSAYVGSFYISTGGLCDAFKTSTSFSRQVTTKVVNNAPVDTTRIGILIDIDQRNSIGSPVEAKIYSIKINGIRIPISEN